MLDVYTFDVMTAPHDDVKRGVLATRRSRVIVSAVHYTYPQAADLAACIAIARHGGMATAVLPRY